MKHGYRINRGLDPGQYRLEDIFTDIRSYGILRAVFADGEIDNVIAHTKVFVVDRSYEMFVDNDDASITVGLTHLRRASEQFLYLDIVHELCHVKQQMQGRNLYDRTKSYVDRETEIDAYRITVQEARRIGLSEDAISDYLRVLWITPEEHQRLVRRLGVTGGKREAEPQ